MLKKFLMGAAALLLSASTAFAAVTFTQSLTVTVNGPFPIAVVFTPTAPALADNAPAGTLIANFVVTMSDGTAFKGTTAIGAGSSNACAISTTNPLQLVTARALTAADVASFTCNVAVTQ